MSHGSLRQLSALLAMPATLRPVLVGRIVGFTPRSTPPHRLFSASSNFYRALKNPDVAAFLIPEYRTSNITEVAPADLFKTSSLLSAPEKPLSEALETLFTKNPASFAYAESDFYKLKKNTRLPEVCILGRSNVGKSSFVNALANRSSNRLAFVSSKAGKTRSINTYGFGPAPTMKELEGKAAEHQGEELPTHQFLLVDMPGYGHASQQEWGKNISLYLAKRTFVKGAMVLIDAEVGPKDSDLHLLELLCQAQLKTAVVLTKADKVRNGLPGMRETCTKLWDALHAIDIKVTEGNWVWDRDIFVTAVGARDSAVAKSTLTTARLAVARLAGLVKDERPQVDRNQKWSGKMISFDDLLYAPSKTGTSAGQGATSASLPRPAPTVAILRNTGGSSKSSMGFASLERASKLQNSARPALGLGLGLGTQGQGGHLGASAFYSTQSRSQAPPKRGKELTGILEDFVKTLKADSRRDQVRRWQQKREEDPFRSLGRAPMEAEQRRSGQFQKRNPQQAGRTREVINERKQMTRDEENGLPSREDGLWGSPTAKGQRKAEVMDQAAFERAFFQSEDDRAAKKSKGKVETAKAWHESAAENSLWDADLMASPPAQQGKSKKKRRKSKKGKSDTDKGTGALSKDDFEKAFFETGNASNSKAAAGKGKKGSKAPQVEEDPFMAQFLSKLAPGNDGKKGRAKPLF
ncbi:hypothetical protein F5Y17DRAFT_156591 [Xylariaceae sp. FL0594]|nr:hypothetical protein F5Y17DRAFT_156591 [Xylariaceae sp. FL0594]